MIAIMSSSHFAPAFVDGCIYIDGREQKSLRIHLAFGTIFINASQSRIPAS